jgi:hypothetical protein
VRELKERVAAEKGEMRRLFRLLLQSLENSGNVFLRVSSVKPKPERFVTIGNLKAPVFVGLRLLWL